MNRAARRAVAARKKGVHPPTWGSSIKRGTAWWWIPVGGITGVSGAWSPFEAIVSYMHGHLWLFPTGWALSIIAHRFIVDTERDRQRRELSNIRQEAAQRAARKGKKRKK